MDTGSAHLLELNIVRAGVTPTERVSKLEQEITELFVKLRDPVYRYTLSISHDPAEAEDVTQDAFLKLYSALLRGESIGNLPAWVFRTAHNLAIDRCRRASRVDHVEPETLENLSGAAADTPERATAEKERRRSLQKAICLLSPQQRRCLELRAEGLRFREIAEVLAVGISTVETLLSRAIRRLSREMDV